MISEINEKAYAKINLSLDILGKREDGYHEMEMVMQTISLWDNIAISASPGAGKLTVTTDRSYIPNNEKNLGYKAAEVFLSECGISNIDIVVKIKKHIPTCAGMGGGSADAAAVLRGLDKLFDTHISLEDMRLLGGKVGSDTVFCVNGGTAVARGRGTELEELHPMFDCGIVVIKPEFSVSTPALFSKIDIVRLMNHPDTKGLIGALKEENYDEFARRCFNVFEDVLSSKEKRYIMSAKDALLSSGASCACMTGTGSAVFGIFRDIGSARKAKEAISEEYNECYAAVPVTKIYE